MIRNNTIDILKNMLDLASARHRIISSNIANADTPGYKTKDIDFYEEMQRAISAKHTSSPRIFEEASLLSNRDENTVSIELETEKLVENAILYEASAHFLTKQFIMIKEDIKGGR